MKPTRHFGGGCWYPMGMKRALTTAYHSQADGKTETMNQTLKISLRACIRPDQNDCTSSLDGLALSYNSTPHIATGFAPAYLLRGYILITGSSLIHSPVLSPKFKVMIFLTSFTSAWHASCFEQGKMNGFQI